jgi:hypothetical protein
MLAQRHARGRNGLPLSRRSCDGARATSSVSTVATLALRSQELRPQVQRLHEVLQCATLLGPSSTQTVLRGSDADHPRRARGGPRKPRQNSLLVGLRRPATDVTLNRIGINLARLKPRRGSPSRVVSDVRPDKKCSPGSVQGRAARMAAKLR